jgi:hypothetical protein
MLSYSAVPESILLLPGCSRLLTVRDALGSVDLLLLRVAVNFFHPTGVQVIYISRQFDRGLDKRMTLQVRNILLHASFDLVALVVAWVSCEGLGRDRLCPSQCTLFEGTAWACWVVLGDQGPHPLVGVGQASAISSGFSTVSRKTCAARHCF